MGGVVVYTQQMVTRPISVSAYLLLLFGLAIVLGTQQIYVAIDVV